MVATMRAESTDTHKEVLGFCLERILVRTAVDQKWGFKQRSLRKWNNLDWDSAKKNSTFSGSHDISINSVGSLSCSHYEQLLASRLQILILFFIIKIEKSQIDCFKKALFLCIS